MAPLAADQLTDVWPLHPAGRVLGWPGGAGGGGGLPTQFEAFDISELSSALTMFCWTVPVARP